MEEESKKKDKVKVPKYKGNYPYYDVKMLYNQNFVWLPETDAV